MKSGKGRVKAGKGIYSIVFILLSSLLFYSSCHPLHAYAEDNVFTDNVGIGTASPLSILHLQSNSGVSNILTMGTPDALGARANFITFKFGGIQKGYIGYDSGSLTRMVVNNDNGDVVLQSVSGNVGIGSTGPAYALDVAGDIRLTGNIIAPAGGSTQGYWQLSGANLIPTSTGYNVGIGTGAPIVSLEVLRSTGANYAAHFANSAAAGSSYGVYIDAGGNSSDSSLLVRDRTGGTLYFAVRGDGQTTMSGNVGIGTTNPGYALDVNGKINSQGSGTTPGLRILTSEGGGLVLNADGTNANPTWQMFSNGNESMEFRAGSANTGQLYLKSDGSVGIGTTSPLALLNVNGANQSLGGAYNVGYGNLLISSNSTTATINTGGTLGFGGQGRTSGPAERFVWATISGRKSTVTSGDPQGYLSFETLNDDTNLLGERMRITADGFVGIGTASPTGKLAVQGSNAGSAMNMDLQNAAAYATGNEVRLRFGASSDFVANPALQNYISVIQTGANNQDFAFGTWNSSLGVGERMRITSAGNVGIGTAVVDSGKLVVAQAESNYASGLAIRGTTLNNSYLWTDAADKFRLDAGATGSRDIILNGAGAGKVGIGSTGPAYALDVAGDIRLTGNIIAPAGGSTQGYWQLSGANLIPTSIGYNVGIGTASPTNLLTVGSGSQAGAALAGLKVALGGNTYISASDNTRTAFMGADVNGVIFGSLTNHNVFFRANNVDHVTITTGGNVGIGTVSPGQSLDVNGTIRGRTWYQIADGTASLGGIGPVYRWKGSGADTNIAIASETSKNIVFFTGGTAVEQMIINTAGNVGIGLTQPAAKLDITGSSGTALQIRSTFGRGIDSQILGTAADNYGVIGYAAGAGTNNYGLYGGATNATGNNWGLYVVNGTSYVAGNVGIGTTVPSSLLNLYSSAPTARVQPSDPAQNAQLQLYWSSGSYFAFRYHPNSAVAYIDTNYSPTVGAAYGDIVFRSDVDGTPRELLRLANYTRNVTMATGGGNVGIGTTVPADKLHVVGTGYAPLILDSSLTGAYISLRLGGVDKTYLQWGMTNTGNAGGSYTLLTNNIAGGSIALQTRQAGGTINFYPLVVSSTGNVGIGTITPASELDVYSQSNPGGVDSTLTLEAYTDAPGEGPAIDFISRWAGIHPNWRVGRIAGVYDPAATNGGALAFYTDNTDNNADGAGLTEQVRINPLGYVGIGSTNPQYKLDVNGGDIRCTGNIYANNITSPSGTSHFSSLIVDSGITVGNAAGNLYTIKGSTSGEYLRLDGGNGYDNSGYLWLTYASPVIYMNMNQTNSRIHLRGGVSIGSSQTDPGSNTNLYVDNQVSAASFFTRGRPYMDANRLYLDGGYAASLTATSTGHNQDIQFFTSGAPGAGGEAVRITNGGYVGIGTAVPSHKFVIRQASGNGNMEFGTDATGGFLQMYDRDTGNYRPFRIMAGTTGSDPGATYFAAAGNVGIGTAAPAAKLDVFGNQLMFAITDPDTTGNNYAQMLFRAGGSHAYIWNNCEGVPADFYGGPGSFNIYQNQSAPIHFYTGGYNYRMVISAAGNVGIGITNPQNRLHVSGNAQIDGDLYISTGSLITGTGVHGPHAEFDTVRSKNVGDELELQYPNNGNVVIYGTNGNLKVQGTGNSYFNGNVGIGSTQPAAKLDVAGLIRNSAPSNGDIQLSGLLPGYADNTYPTLKSSGGTLYFSVSNGYTGYIQSPGLYFKGFYDFDNLLYYVDPASNPSAAFAGKVGIGMTNPTLAQLQVDGNFRLSHTTYTATPAVNLIGGISGNDEYVLNVQNYNTNTGYTNNGIYVTVANGSKNYGIQIASTPAGSDNYAIYSTAAAKSYFAGSVGIGTTSPQKMLSIHSDTNGQGILITNSQYTAGSYSEIRWGHSQVDPFYGSAIRFRNLDTANGGNLSFWTDNGTGTLTERMTIDRGGNVGIGTTGPRYKIEVVGTAGLSTGTAWTNSSDARFKDIKSQITGSSLSKILALKPVSYTWNQLHDSKFGKNPGLKYGFIAQDVQKVIPEFITQDPEGYLQYNPSGMEAILAAAIKEQQAQIALLREELAELKKQVGELKKK